jgi:hypothetical protein
MVIDAAGGRVLGSSPLRCRAAGSHPVPHPDGRHVGLSVGEGQDGAEIYWGHWEDDRPVVERLDDRSRVLMDVRPSGTGYLTTPHPSGESIALHEFPSGRVFASLAESAVLEQDDYFDLPAGYVNDEMVLVASVVRQEHLLLGAQTLAPVGVVAYPPAHAKDCVTPSGRGTWMTSDYVSGNHHLWRLAEDE